VTHAVGVRIGRTPNVPCRPIPILAPARAPPALVRHLPTGDNPHVGGGMASSRFVGRANELELLAAGLEAIHEGRATTFVIAGEAGVGKTRLIEEFLSRAEAVGAVGLVGGCLDLEEGRLPFGPFIEALRPRVRELDPAARQELAALGGDELAPLLPELEPDEEDRRTTATVAQARLFELVLSLLSGLASADPLALVFEDVHWSDRSTRDLLAFLARNLRGERVQLIATYRSDELYRGHPLRSFLAELERNRRVQRIDLEPFTRDEVGEQLADILGDRVDTRLVESVFERSQGNAFLAEELVAAGARSATASSPSCRRWRSPSGSRPCTRRRRATCSNRAGSTATRFATSSSARPSTTSSSQRSAHGCTRRTGRC
jgi:AAA ATPase domain